MRTARSRAVTTSKRRQAARSSSGSIDASPLAPKPEPPEETGATFEANARLKAEAVARTAGAWTLAEDSGLVVPALHGRPGVYSARYAGPSAKDGENIARLLSELRQCQWPRPFAARFRCVLALARKGESSR